MGGPSRLKIRITLCLKWVIERYSIYADWAINQWVSIVLSSYFLQVLVTFCCLSNDRVLSLLGRAGGSQPKTSEYFWVQISKVGRHRGTPEQTGSSISFLGTALTISSCGDTLWFSENALFPCRSFFDLCDICWGHSNPGLRWVFPSPTDLHYNLVKPFQNNQQAPALRLRESPLTVVTSSLVLFTTAPRPLARWGSQCLLAQHHGRHLCNNNQDSPQLYMTATVATNSLTCTISGVIVGGIELPFNGCPKNACEHMSEGAITILLPIPYTLLWKYSNIPNIQSIYQLSFR